MMPVRVLWRMVHVLGNAVCAWALVFVALPGLAGADDPGWIPGEATAAADSMGFVLGTGGTRIEVALGRSIARYQATLGSAEGRAVDLGALSILFGDASKCNDSPPLLPTALQPPITSTDSQQADSATSRRVAVAFPGLHGEPSTAPAGFQDATATPQPASRALTDTTSGDLGLLAVDNPHTDVDTSLAGHTRRAHATSWADQIRVLGGLITIDRPRWEAVATSGDTTSATGSFTFASATVLGFSRTADQLPGDAAAFDQVLNNLLSGLGAHLDYPRLDVSDGRLRVTPLRLRLTDPPAGPTSLGPFISWLRPLITQFENGLTQQDCNNAAILQVVEVVLSVLSGNGTFEEFAGGVDVRTAATDFPSGSDPATAFTLPLDTIATPTTAAEPPVPPTPAAAAVTEPPTTAPAPVPAPVPTEVSVPPSVADATVARTTVPPRPAATSPVAALSRREIGGTTGGTAAIVGAIALAGTVALAVADRLVMRGRRVGAA